MAQLTAEGLAWANAMTWWAVPHYYFRARLYLTGPLIEYSADWPNWIN